MVDWDGTVVASIGSIVACARQAMLDIGLTPAVPELVASTIGLALPEIADRLLGPREARLRARWVERYRVLWMTRFRHDVELLPGAAEAIRELDADGYLLAVATGKSRRGLDRDLEKTGLGPCFRALRTADDGPSKPHPAILLALMTELGADAEATLMVGDALVDHEMARAAGVRSLGVTTGTLPREALAPYGPCLESLAQLPAWLAGHRRP